MRRPRLRPGLPLSDNRSHETDERAATAHVANQESQAPEKQQRAGCRPPSAIRLAHLPGEAAVPPGAARLLTARHDTAWIASWQPRPDRNP
jgi:hypothetical protein